MTWVSSFHGGPSPVTAALESWGLRPHVGAIVPSYLWRFRKAGQFSRQMAEDR